MKRKNVKKNLLDHSEAKVKLLGEYIKKYLSVISNDGYTQGVRIFDLFCGEGLYDNAGEGSPLVLLNAINEVAKESQKNNRKIPTIRCYFNDKDEAKIKKLKSVISHKKHITFNCEITYSSYDYLDIVDSLVNQLVKIQNEKIFIFIDPYGYKNIRASQINRLMISKKSEVLLWLPTQHMYRFSENGTPEALYDFLEEFEIDENEATKNVWKFIKQLNAGFQKSISDSFYVDYFSIKKDKNTVFCLYFFTSHIRGFEKMMETKWNIDTEFGRGWEFSGNTPTLFHSHKTNELEILLKDFIKSGIRYNGDVYKFTLDNKYLPTHATQILEDWQINNMVEVISPIGDKVRKKSFYIKYFKRGSSENKKVYFKLK